MTDDGAFCPAYASIELLQEKWTLHIIRALLESPLGFNELGRAVGANPTTLAHRLERLEQLGVLERTVHSVMPRGAPGRDRRYQPLGTRAPAGPRQGKAAAWAAALRLTQRRPRLDRLERPEQVPGGLPAILRPSRQGPENHPPQ